MLPEGGAYIPYKGTAKVARQLGFDFAEAVTGFEFKKRRAFPIITGIVLAAENEEAVLEAYWKAENEAAEKRRAKRHEAVIKRWTRLIHGLRIRQRLQEQYAGRSGGVQAQANGEVDATEHQEQVEHPTVGGGFLTVADEVVQPYSLPRNWHEVPHTAAPSTRQQSSAEDGDDGNHEDDDDAPLVLDGLEIVDGSDLEEVEVQDIPAPQANGVPKSMRELAEDVEMQIAESSAAEEDEEVIPIPKDIPPKPAKGRKTNERTQAATVKKTSPSQRTTPARRPKKRTRGASPTPVQSDNDEASQPTPTKRSRTTRPPPPPPAVKSDRVLRTRAGKSAAKLQEEKEQEEAYRRATTN